MKPRSMPYASCRTFATGATQLVVQEALETMWCCSGSYSRSLTPRTTVRSGSVAGAEMTTLRAPACRCFGAFAVGEEAGRLDRDVDAELLPRQVAGILLGEQRDRAPADGDGTVAELDRNVELSEHGVVLEQVRHRLRVAEVVGGHDLEVATELELGAEEVAPDPAEAVDPDLDLRHRLDPLCVDWPSVECNERLFLAGGRTGKLRGRPSRPFTPLETWRQTGSESAAGRARTRRGEYTTLLLPR